jgi:peptidoglycan/xylan/chitin deacetylase (PgdA/CDA1 family)
MTPDQVRALPPDLVDVQLHTHRHRTPREEQAFRRELRDNRAMIERLAPGAEPPAVHFCYPSGDYDAAFLPWLRAEGVRSATTCVPGIASAADDPLLLPRFVDTEHQPLATFEAWVSGFASTVPMSREYRLDVARRLPRQPDPAPLTTPS